MYMLSCTRALHFFPKRDEWRVKYVENQHNSMYIFLTEKLSHFNHNTVFISLYANHFKIKIYKK